MKSSGRSVWKAWESIHLLFFSAGIAFAPQDGDTFMELYQKADFALYQVKRSGRDGYRIYK